MGKEKETETGLKKEPTFFQDSKKYLTTVKFHPCRIWYIVFLLSFVAALTFQIRLRNLLPGRFQPNSEEVSLCIEMVNLVANILIVTTPCAFIFAYCKIPQKHISMIIAAILGMCVCFSLSGIVNELTWIFTNEPERIQSFIDYEKAEYVENTKLSLYLRSTETAKNCCGVRDFMDYPLDIFSGTRAPDHCCTNYTKGCAINTFMNTPLSYAKKRNPPPDNNSTCLLDVTVTAEDLKDLTNYEKNASRVALLILMDDFNISSINKSYLCDDLTLGNYLDPICVTLQSNGNRFFAHKFRWCFTVFFNDTPRSYGKLINDKFNYFTANGCYPHFVAYADEVVNWSLISSMSTVAISVILLIVYLKLYRDYRPEQLTIYPLPSYLQKFPDEPEENLPRGLGRRCHVNHFLALTTDKEASEFLHKNPQIKKEGLAKIRENEEALQIPIESVPKYLFKVTQQNAPHLEHKNIAVDSEGITETDDEVIDIYRRSATLSPSEKKKDKKKKKRK